MSTCCAVEVVAFGKLCPSPIEFGAVTQLPVVVSVLALLCSVVGDCCSNFTFFATDCSAGDSKTQLRFSSGRFSTILNVYV